MKQAEFVGGNESPTGYDRNELAKKHNEKWGEQKHVTRRKVESTKRFLL